jgi:hypothetical protein
MIALTEFPKIGALVSRVYTLIYLASLQCQYREQCVKTPGSALTIPMHLIDTP